MTKRLADKIAGLAQVLPIKHVAAWFGVSWDTVKQIDQRALAARLGPVEGIDLVCEALRHPLIAIEPRHRFDRRPAARTLQARARHNEPRVALQQRQIANAPRRDLMYLDDDLAE